MRLEIPRIPKGAWFHCYSSQSRTSLTLYLVTPGMEGTTTFSVSHSRPLCPLCRHNAQARTPSVGSSASTISTLGRRGKDEKVDRKQWVEK
ncbi:hypothetical protein E2C01_006828 [Portunus trituberculatus]|uniref:Uncharacterized protein n=1 Tax=Portunus trituberculatus TaxID=210409 RepID=A0A5B7CZ71_PORTR|nr:hypothetical protein [Portunus trituberculatus]